MLRLFKMKRNLRTESEIFFLWFHNEIRRAEDTFFLVVTGTSHNQECGEPDLKQTKNKKTDLHHFRRLENDSIAFSLFLKVITISG